MNKIIIAVVVIVIVAAGGFFLLSGSSAPQAPIESGQASPTEAASENPAPSEAVREQENSITLTEDGFSPKTLTIRVGTKVTWTNNNGKVSTVHSVPHPAHTTYPPLNLGQFADGKSLSLTFDKAGTYFYHNHLDANQNGSVVVE